MSIIAMSNVPFNKILPALTLSLLLISPTCAATGGTPNPEQKQAEKNNPGIVIISYQIEGNTLLSEQEMQEVVAPFLGDKQQITDVQKALEALEAYYRAKGYGEVLVTLPEQELSKGVVRLQVIEPLLKNISIEYRYQELEEYYPKENLLESLPDLKAGEILNSADISRNVQLANENPAKHVEIVLRSKDKPGELDAGVKVNGLPPRKAFVSVDNTGTDTTGEYRMGFGLQHANLWGLDHVATFNYITPIIQPGNVNLFSGSYRIPVYALGDSIDITAAKSDVGNTTTSTVAGPLQFAGSGDIYGLNYNLLLPRWGEYTHRVISGYSYRQYSNSCSIGTFGSGSCGPTGQDITLMPLSLTYSGQFASQEQTFNFYLTGAHNLPGMSHGGQNDFNLVRPGASGAGGAPAGYTLFKGGYNYMALLGADWQMRLAGNGQYSADPLVYIEQFGLAGSTMVRGFWEREVTRDIGYALNTELYGPNLASEAGIGDNLRGLIFYDYGTGRNNNLAGESHQAIALSSVGFGLRFGYNQSFQLKFDGSYVLNGDTATGPSSHAAGDARAHLSVSMPYSF